MGLYLYLTSGIKENLLTYIENYPHHDFLLLENNQQHILINESNELPIFEQVTPYINIFQFGTKKKYGHAVYQKFSLQQGDEKIFLLQFEALKNQFAKQLGLHGFYLLKEETNLHFAFLSFWDTETDFDSWKKTQLYHQILSPFLNEQTATSSYLIRK
ncbi:antibiotic biosynthesis monooxygenase [Isobaculum melis]|uniref:Antibiotic biosynthesis monooxygenase n=1 Tax=Isobaculum melis TaxID=142588 RepID=A0A1H9QKC3_9LACT|nr:antibiotic biosynthesis monooxygenase [Isobaculum melis]SER60645.1 Antibiotic biosynthesis monooxygenase [Isobaculum melis]